MGLESIVGPAVTAAAAATESLRLDVRHRAHHSSGELGVRSFLDPVTLSALVQEGELQMTTIDGREILVRALLMFFPPEDGKPPPTITMLDELTLPSGYSAPIAHMPDVAPDPRTGEPYARIVWLG